MMNHTLIFVLQFWIPPVFGELSSLTEIIVQLNDQPGELLSLVPIGMVVTEGSKDFSLLENLSGYFELFFTELIGIQAVSPVIIRVLTSIF